MDARGVDRVVPSHVTSQAKQCSAMTDSFFVKPGEVKPHQRVR